MIAELIGQTDDGWLVVERGVGSRGRYVTVVGEAVDDLARDFGMPDGRDPGLWLFDHLSQIIVDADYFDNCPYQSEAIGEIAEAIWNADIEDDSSNA